MLFGGTSQAFGGAMSITLEPGEAAAVRRARQRFAAGLDDVPHVRPAIASSWLRCRDSFEVDPGLTIAPPAGDSSRRCLDRDVLLTELGGLAASVQPQLAQSVVTVVDADGRLVGAWGDGVRAASDVRLVPRYSWSEAATGTNGMGTALRSHALTAIRGPEHWCEGFHGLDCLATPITDPVTGEALAAVNVSTATGLMPRHAGDLLRSVARTMRERLEARAREQAVDLAEAFRALELRGPRPVLALDTGGRVVAATDEASRLLSLSRVGVSIELRDRIPLPARHLEDVIARAAHAAHLVPGWTGRVQVELPAEGEAVEATLSAVLSAGHPIGFLVSLGSSDGEALPAIAEPKQQHPSRVVALRRGRTVLLAPVEIRCAQAQGNTVWLTTAHGRLKAAERGLKNLEAMLEPKGFVRVHRRYLVNLNHVREVGRGATGELVLVLDDQHTQPIPVSRRRTGLVRARLGL